MAADRYSALLLFESTSSDRNHAALHGEDVVLLRAASAEAAQRLDDAHGRAQECTYRNAEGHTISPRLVRVVDVATALYSDLNQDDLNQNDLNQDVAVDLYARHFRDLSSYRAFEPLLEGDPR